MGPRVAEINCGSALRLAPLAGRGRIAWSEAECDPGEGDSPRVQISPSLRRLPLTRNASDDALRPLPAGGAGRLPWEWAYFIKPAAVSARVITAPTSMPRRFGS